MIRPVPASQTMVAMLVVSMLTTVGVVAQTPLTLADAIREVRRNSDETRLITEKSSKLQAMKSELWSAALPNVSAYANAGRGKSPFNLGSLPLPGDTTGNSPSVYSATQNMFSYGVQLQQTLLSPSLGQSIVTAGKQIRAQNAANQRSIQELELQALDAFYAVIMAETKLRVLESSLERQSRTVGFLESNFDRGAGSRSTVLLTRASLKALEPERIRAANDVDASRMAFNRLLGREIDAPLTLDTTSVLDASVLPTMGSDAALENRPDLLALRLQKETLEGYARVYRLQYLPSIGFQGKLGVLAYELDEQLTDFDNNLEWQVGVGLTWTLFDGFGHRAKARQYDSDVRTLEANERQARAYARIQLQSAYREVNAADTALAAAQEARDASAEAAELIGRDFRAGAGQVTDLLSAEEGLRNAELGLIAARYQKTRARAALQLALGKDLTKEISK
jgi:outer membrane protein